MKNLPKLFFNEIIKNAKEKFEGKKGEKVPLNLLLLQFFFV